MRRIWVQLAVLLACCGLAHEAAADGKCANVDCNAVQKICYATLDLDPVTCGLYYGCCYGQNEKPSSELEPPEPADSALTVGPAEIVTATAPSGASAKKTCVILAADKNGRVFYNWWKTGQGGHGWKELEGGRQTDATPAGALVGKYLFVMIKGLDKKIYLNQGDIASKFNGWQNMGFASEVAPSAASSGNTAVAVAVKKGRVYYNWWQLGQGGSGWKSLQNNITTDVAPAASLIGGYLFVVIKGIDGNLYLNQGGLGKPFVGWQRMGDLQTNRAVGATSSGDTAAVVATNREGRVFYNYWKLGEGGHGWKELEGGGRTDAAPAASLVGDYLFVAIKGPNGNIQLNQGNLENPFVGWR